MEIWVTPGALESSGSALERAGSSLADVAANVRATAGSGAAAAADPSVIDAFEQMISVWHRELASLAEAVTTTGRATRSASSAYVEADDAAVPTGR